jgi:GNAT superfamily N-acetyltransferase
MTANPPSVLSDLALARRLERAEGAANAAFVEGRAIVEPDVGAEWTEVAGAYAMFDGVGSPMTQTFGLGVFDPVGEAEMEALEGFFARHGAGVHHEVSPMADPSILPLLTGRGYRPIELTSVLYRPIAPGVSVQGRRDDAVRVRMAEPGEMDAWSALAARGWNDVAGDLSDFFTAIGRINAVRRGSLSLVAELDGQPIATGGMSIHGGVALMAGASTAPEWRGRGAQLALLEARLRHAAEHGCDLAAMGALPGSTSQKNAERQGFRIAYTRIKWQRG